MKIKQWTSMAVVCCSIIALTACSTKHRSQDDLAINDANSAYSQNDGAQSSGLGQDSNFGDEGSSGAKHLASSSSGRTYYFDYDSNAVHDTDKSAIVANAEKISASPGMKTMVEGHTDPRGSREYNIGLGERRAKAVAQILTTNGVKHNQVRIVSYGAEKLASPGHSEADYQRDRRGVLVYLQ